MRRAPFVFYCHAYEFAPDDFSGLEPAAPALLRLHQGLGRGWMAERLRAFLRAFGGRRVADYLAESTPLRVFLDRKGKLNYV